MNALNQSTIDLLTHSAQNYFNYLKERELGFEELRIQSITQNIFGLQFQLYSKIYSLEGLILHANDAYYPISENGEIQASFYDEKTKNLILNITNPTLKEKLTKNTKIIKLYSDLKFLVENVRDFFVENQKLTLPQIASSINATFSSEDLHKEQITALNGIFSSPLCYIWGAAGSGKTKVVLLHALATYIQKDMRVVILAPTNNALEQSLSSLLERLNEIGIDTQNILRLGTPSQSFAERFSINCDPILLDRQAYKTKLDKSLVIAATLDTFLRREELRSLKFHHFFIDEAGFTPLVKALSLCAYNKPITLLGDHKQLKPICMLDKKDFNAYFPSKLWFYSALFMESFFALQENFLEKSNPKEPLLPKNTFILTHTYRYGDNLAKLLDAYIYKNGLCGQNTQTNLYLFPVVNHQDTKELQNPQEAEGCIKLAKTLINRGKEFAIITPFVKQRKLILEKFSLLRQMECVFTIHSSQGQEFDTVIFSPVCLHYHLSDSRNEEALYSLNVALSRAKKEIIFVCDKNYWNTYPTQFLTQIIKISKVIYIKEEKNPL